MDWVALAWITGIGPTMALLVQADRRRNTATSLALALDVGVSTIWPVALAGFLVTLLCLTLLYPRQMAWAVREAHARSKAVDRARIGDHVEWTQGRARR